MPVFRADHGVGRNAGIEGDEPALMGDGQRQQIVRIWMSSKGLGALPSGRMRVSRRFLL